jgi:hypothetical protein
MWQICPPIPEDEIVRVRWRAMGEAGHNYAGASFGDEARCDLPGRRHYACLGDVEPGAGHIGERYAVTVTLRVVTQIDNVRAIDVVGAERAGIDLVCESLIDLQDGGREVEREIKRLHIIWIESAAM